MTGSLPTLVDVEDRLAELLSGFAPDQITEARRAEDLASSAMALHAAGLRRAVALATEADPGVVERWRATDPLGGLLDLHGAELSADDEALARRSAEHIAGTVGPLADAGDEISARTLAVLGEVVDLHEAAWAQLLGVAGERRPPPESVVRALVGDHLVAGLLLTAGLHPESLEARVERTVARLDERSGPVASVEVVSVAPPEVHLRVSADQPRDAHRLRLLVERAVADELPDVVALRIEGGDQADPPATAFIPVEALTRRRGAS